MRVCVTGVAGFIGFSLCRALLQRGDIVVGIDNLNDYYSIALKMARVEQLRQLGGNRFAFLELDFADQDALATGLVDFEIDRIVHLGAQAGVRYSLENPRAYLEANITGHFNLLELARERQVEHMVYASSSSVYGNNEKVPFAESDRVDHPISFYAATKKADELLSETYAHLHRLPLTGLRFFTVYGPWGRPDMMMWIFTSRILAGEPLPVFNGGEVFRDYTYIDDIVWGLLASLDHPPADDGSPKAGDSRSPHAIYNIGNNRCERLLDVIHLLEQACEREAILDIQPMQAGDVSRTYADIGAIARDLGYSPSVSVEEGVPRFVAWYRDYTGT